MPSFFSESKFNLCFITSNNSFNNRFSDCLKENYKEMANFLGSTVSTTVEALMKESPIEELKVMTNRFIGLVSLKSQQNIFSTYKYDFITLSCMTVAAIISLILTFVKKIRCNLKASLLATTSAVILVSVCASIALFVQSVHYAIIILCMTVAIFILAALSGFFTKIRWVGCNRIDRFFIRISPSSIDDCSWCLLESRNVYCDLHYH
ncbi:unnamed protein product [Heterobilharzia americana]|nr:unnamed protein product [Heterobilharzia americana]